MTKISQQDQTLKEPTIKISQAIHKLEGAKKDLLIKILSELGHGEKVIINNILSNVKVGQNEIREIIELLFEKIVTNESLNQKFYSLQIRFEDELKAIKSLIEKEVANEIIVNDHIRKISTIVYNLFTDSLFYNIENNSQQFFNMPTYPMMPKEISIYNLFDLKNEISKTDIKQKIRISEEIVDIKTLKEFETQSHLKIADLIKNSFYLDRDSNIAERRKRYVLFKFFENLDYRLKRGEIFEYIEQFKKIITELPENWISKISSAFNMDQDKILVELLKLDFDLEEYFKNSENLWKRFIFVNRLSLLDFKMLYEYWNPKATLNLNELFNIWILKFKSEANQILTNRLSIDKDSWFGGSLKNLEKFLKTTILKSEIVEKNDGKASYIIKKLFEAYLTNPHQLPDLRLLQIAQKVDNCKEQIETESKEKYNHELEQMNNEIHFKKDLERLNWENTSKLDEDESKRYPKEFIQFFSAKNDLRDFLKNNHKNEINEIRRYIDNTILISLNSYQKLLSRLICDHIAGLTDRDALGEFEKLYFGVMEIA
jgi:hypothetical protein